MNKYQEALDKIKSEQLWDEGLGDYYPIFDRDNEELKLLQELVDKATPKKPFDYHTHYNCPTCQKRVRSGKGSSSQIRDTVCRSCYQVLDWSSDD